MLELLDKNDKVINKDIYTTSRLGRKDGSWHGVPKYVSAYDLHKALKLNHNDVIPNDVLLCYLYELGIDTENHSVIEQQAWHRPISAPTNSPIYATRWVGQERTDRAWVESGNASKEVRIAAANFSDLGSELEILGRQSNFTAEILEHMVEKKNVSGRKDGKTSALGGHA